MFYLFIYILRLAKYHFVLHRSHVAEYLYIVINNLHTTFIGCNKIYNVLPRIKKKKKIASMIFLARSFPRYHILKKVTRALCLQLCLTNYLNDVHLVHVNWNFFRLSDHHHSSQPLIYACMYSSLSH